MWVARDPDGMLHLFHRNEPWRTKVDIGGGETKECWDNDDGEWMELHTSEFSDLKWEDEPIEVELKQKTMKFNIEIELNDVAVETIEQYIHDDRDVSKELTYVIDEALNDYLNCLTDDEYEVKVKTLNNE